MPKRRPDNFYQTSHVCASHWPFFPLYLPCDSELTRLLGSACCVLAYCCARGRLARAQVYFLYGGTHSGLFSSCWCLTSAKTRVQLVIPLTCADSGKGAHSVAQEEAHSREHILLSCEQSDLKSGCSAWGGSYNFCH